MSLFVNTNVSSLTAQRALASADSLQAEAMTRLSTGSKINSASDDAAGLAIAQRMTSQVNGLNMAVKNANDGIALTQSVEGALVEVADMLQRMRELAVQSANDTNTGTDRKAIQAEVDLLTAEISRVSSNTRFNNQKVLDGSFTNVQLQVGTQAGETISFSMDSTASSALGAFKVSGDIIQAQQGAGSGAFANMTDASDDIIINGNANSKTIDVAALDSAEAVASKINAFSGDTGVSAESKTFAKVFSVNAADQTLSFKVNNTTTGDFVMSKSNVSDAVDKINAISGTTGVTATKTDTNEVLLFSATGKDILVENEKAFTSIRMKAVGFDGVTEVKTLGQSAKKEDSAVLTASTAHTFKNLTSGANAAFTTTAVQTANEYQSLINNSLGATSGTAGVRVSTSDITAITTGDYYFSHNETADVYKLNLANATLDGWSEALRTAKVFGGDHDNVSRSLKDDITVTQNGNKLQLTGSRLFGDFDVYSDSITSLTVMDSAQASHVVGEEGTGVEVSQRASDGLGRESRRSASLLAITATGTTTSFSTNIAASAFAASPVSSTSAASFTAATGVLSQESALSFTATAAAGSALITVVGKDADNNVITETVDLTADTLGTSRAAITQGAAAQTELATVTAANIHSDLTTDDATFSIALEDVVYGFQIDAAGRTSAQKIADVVLAINSHEEMSLQYTAAVTGGNVVITSATANTNVTDINFFTNSTGAASGQTESMFKSITSITAGGTVAGSIGVHIQDNTDNFSYRGARAMGDFDIVQGGPAVTTSAITAAAGVTTLQDFTNTDIGNYTLRNKSTGVDTVFTVATASTAANWEAGLDAALGANMINVAVGATGAGNENAAALVFTATASFAGDFEILEGGKEITAKSTDGVIGTAAAVKGDADSMDIELAAVGGQDSGTVQGTLELSGSKLFSVTQSGTEESYSATAPIGPRNDNYFTTKAAALSTVSNVDLRTQAGSANALSVIDGAIEKISSMRGDLGAIENRLDHTVNNLMNLSEKTEQARSYIQDADFAAESAKLSKAQVLKQAGVGMLAQANASSQLVLQLLQ